MTRFRQRWEQVSSERQCSKKNCSEDGKLPTGVTTIVSRRNQTKSIDFLREAHFGRDFTPCSGKVTTAIVNRTELARLQRSLNVQLRVVEDKGKRGIHVDWARRGRADLTLWDDTGIWQGMPEKIEQAIYGGLTEADQERLEKATPTSFPNVETAIAWGFEQGVFEVINHARNAYDVIKRECQPKTAAEMWEL